MASVRVIFLVTTTALLLLYLSTGVNCDPTKIQNGLFTKSPKERVVIYLGRDSEIKKIAGGIAERHRNSSKEERIFAFYEKMSEMYNRDSAVKDFLQQNGVHFQHNWATNTLVLQNADENCVRKLAEMRQVSYIRGTRRLEAAAGSSSPKNYSVKYDAQNTPPQPFGIGTAWGVARIRAREAWAFGTFLGELKDGKSAVVGHIGAGVWAEHEQLRESFRVINGWADGFNLSPVPVDEDGSGTHQMGIVVGKKYGVGVAPGAQWMACRACTAKDVCDTDLLLWCFDWMLCPYNTRELAGPASYKDCSGAPDVVLNTWYTSPGSTEFDRSIDALYAANILVVWGVGSLGPECGTIRSPADHPNVIGVTGVDENDSNSEFTGNGPTSDGRIKPDITGPSDNIVSASISCPTCYITITGTSQAASHTAGLLLLLIDRCRIPFETAMSVLTRTAQKENLGTTEQICGGTPSDVFPNNFYGYGRIDALDAVTSMLTVCPLVNFGPGGTGSSGGAGWSP